METATLKPVTLKEFGVIVRNKQFNYELIDGIVMLSPLRTPEHQNISAKLVKAIEPCLEATNCILLLEIELKSDQTSLVPDLSIICMGDQEDLFYHGFPLLVMEILNPKTAQHDLIHKYKKYRELGISEYWIIDPQAKTITAHYFFNKTAEMFSQNATALSLIHPEIQLKLSDLF